jgi:hypothetical protein
MNTLRQGPFRTLVRRSGLSDRLVERVCVCCRCQAVRANLTFLAEGLGHVRVDGFPDVHNGVHKVFHCRQQNLVASSGLGMADRPRLDSDRENQTAIPLADPASGGAGREKY